jgi:uncharacterized protein (DUF488 family)
VSLYTIGFTKHFAEQFFETLKSAGVKKLIDIRINKTSQLAGFAKGSDLPYFLRVSAGIAYESIENLAPAKDLLKRYRSKEISWEEFEDLYLKQIKSSGSLEALNPKDFENACLLCSEHTSEKCHRRLLAEELQKLWGIQVVHL